MTNSPTPHETRESSSFRIAALLSALVVVSVAVVGTAHERTLGRLELSLADQASARGDWPEAILRARGAAEAFVIASPWPERGEQRLQAIGHDAEARADATTALLAYGAARTAALATRAPGSNSARWRTEAEAGLARVAGWDSAGTNGRTGAPKPRETSQAMLDALARPEPPSTWTLAALSASVIALLCGIGWLAFREDDRRARVAQSFIALAVVTYVAVLLTN